MGEELTSFPLEILIAVIGILLIIWILKPNKSKFQGENLTTLSILTRAPSGAGIFITKCIIVTILFVTMNILISYSEDITEFEQEKCEEKRYRNKHNCIFEEFTSTDISKQIDGFLMNEEVTTNLAPETELNHWTSPNGPWFWAYYLIGSVLILSSLRIANKRRKQHIRALRAVEQQLRPIIRRLANDPRGVVEGRITMPDPIPASTPQGREKRRITAIFLITSVISIITLVTMIEYFAAGNTSFLAQEQQNREVSLLTMMALGLNVSSNVAVRFLSATYAGEGENNLTSENVSRAEVPLNRTKPRTSTSAKEVLEELAKEMRAARIESEMLRVQLNETRIQVSNLETELERKTTELEAIQALSADMERIVNQSENSTSKNLSLMDSVLVGDPLFNGDKIDKQVVNDPKAIAKAAIEAYKAGRTDVKSAELDF